MISVDLFSRMGRVKASLWMMSLGARGQVLTLF